MVSVRSADIAVHLRQLPVRHYSASPKKIVLKGPRVPPGYSVDLGNGMAVIAGGNGAGKSSLLQAIRICLDSSMLLPEDSVGWFSQVDEIEVQWSDDRQKSGLISSQIQVVRLTGGETQILRSGSVPESVHYIDAAVETGRILAMLRDDPNYLDLLEGVDPSPATPDALTLASYVLNRNFDFIDTYEITSVSADDLAVPFFRVRALGTDYSVLGMGRGELATIYLLWRLEQISSGGIVILEEPETHLAAISQRKLTEALAIISAKSDLTIIMSTHSPGVFDSLPVGQVSLIGSLPTMSVTTGLDSKALASRLGLRRQLRCVAVTEDLFAAQMLETVLGAMDRSLLDSVAIAFSKDGESGVRTVINGLSSYRSSGATEATHRVVGVLDGDQRTTGSDPADFSYLPGELPPERLIHDRLMAWYAGNEEFDDFSVDTEAKLREALLESQGLDHHDWLISVARRFNGSGHLLESISSFLFQDAGFTAQANILRSFLNSL